MDDERIRQLTEEVLAAIRDRPKAAPASSLEARVARLEAAAGEPHGPAQTVAAAAVVVTRSHPSLRVFGVAGGGEGSCLIEPDKPCERSGMCRVLGH